MCIQKLRYAQDKQQAIAKQDRRSVAQLLKAGKETKAHYRVESLISNDVHVELLEILELYCELLHARVNILSLVDDEVALISNHLDDGINEAVRALVYSVAYVPEVRELQQLRDLMTFKFGPEFTNAILQEQVGVPDKVLSKCSPKLPSTELVELYLREIAKTYDAPYSRLMEDDITSTDGVGDDDINKPILALNNDEVVNEGNSPIVIRKPRKGSENIDTDLSIPGEVKDNVKFGHKTNKKSANKINTEDEELEKLKMRFAALRK